MNHLEVLTGEEPPLEIYPDIVPVLEDVELLPGRLEPIYRKAIAYEDDSLDRLRFALVRIQIYSDIHRTEDMEKAQKIKYVAQVLEKVIFGSLLLEHEELGHD